MMLIWPLLIIGGFYLYKEGKLFNDHGKEPLRALDERYARGDIDEATYLKMKEQLKG